MSYTIEQLDCAVYSATRHLRAEVERLRAALSALLAEHLDAPLERRRKEWEAACQQAREALES